MKNDKEHETDDEQKGYTEPVEEEEAGGEHQMDALEPEESPRLENGGILYISHLELILSQNSI